MNLLIGQGVGSVAACLITLTVKSMDFPREVHMRPLIPFPSLKLT